MIEDGVTLPCLNEVIEIAKRLELQGNRNIRNEELSIGEREEWRDLRDEALITELMVERKNNEGKKEEDISYLEMKEKEKEMKEKFMVYHKMLPFKLNEKVRTNTIRLINSLQFLSVSYLDGRITTCHNNTIYRVEHSSSFLVGYFLDNKVHRMSFEIPSKNSFAFFVYIFIKTRKGNGSYYLLPKRFGVITYKLSLHSTDLFFFDVNGDTHYLTPVKEGDSVTLEVDLRSNFLSERNVYCYLNNKQLPFYSSNLTDKVIFGINLSGHCDSVKFVSYEVLDYLAGKPVSRCVELSYDLFVKEVSLIKGRKNNSYISLCNNNNNNNDDNIVSINNIGNHLRISDNRFVHSYEFRWETCIINEVMEHDVFRATFRFRTLKCTFLDSGLVGVMDSSLKDKINDADVTKVDGIIKLFLNSGELFNSDNELAGGIRPSPFGGLISLELDLRSHDKEKRSMKFFVNGEEQTFYITHLPPSVQFLISLKQPGTCISLISIEKLKEPVNDNRTIFNMMKRIEFKWKREDNNSSSNNNNSSSSITTNNSSLSLSQIAYYSANDYNIKDNFVTSLKDTSKPNGFLMGDRIQEEIFSFSFKIHGKEKVSFYLSRSSDNKRLTSILPVEKEYIRIILFNGIVFLETEFIREGTIFAKYTESDIFTIEADFKSKNSEERTMHIFKNGKQLPLFINNLPNDLQFQLRMRGTKSKVEFISFEKLKESKAEKMKNDFKLALNPSREETKESLNRVSKGISLSYITSLSSLVTSFSSKRLFIKDNYILHSEGRGYETCIIGNVMTNGIYRIALRPFNYCNRVTWRFSIGVVDYLLGCPESGRSITESHKGVAIDFPSGLFKDVKNEPVGLGFCFGLTSLFVMELNLTSKDPEKRTMRMFTNGCENSVYFTHLPSFVHFAISLGNEGHVMYLQSLEKLAVPTVSDRKGKGVNWGKGLEKYEEHNYPKGGNVVSNLIPLSPSLSLSDFKGSTQKDCDVQNRIIRRTKETHPLGVFIFDKEMKKGVNLFKFKIKNFSNIALFTVTDKNAEEYQRDFGLLKDFIYVIVKKIISERIPGLKGVKEFYESKNGMYENLEVWLQIDMRSKDKEKRTVHFIINGEQQNCYFYNIPDNIKVAFILSTVGDCLEFVSWEELKEPITKHLKWEYCRKFITK